MEFWLFGLPPLIGVLGLIALVAVVAVVLAFFLNQGSYGLKKSQENKILLKQLLEGFGLEVPSELKDPEGAVIKSSKTN